MILNTFYPYHIYKYNNLNARIHELAWQIRTDLKNKAYGTRKGGKQSNYIISQTIVGEPPSTYR